MHKSGRRKCLNTPASLTTNRPYEGQADGYDPNITTPPLPQRALLEGSENMSTITRRQTLTGTAAIAAAAVLPSMPAQATAEPVNEPLLDMAREWWALRDYSENHPDQSDKVQDPIHEQLSAMERVIYLTPARTIQGVLVKSRINNIAAFTEESFFGNLDDILSVDPAKFTCFDKMAPIAIYQDLQRLAGRAVS